jgi:hypothetical protein
MTDTSTLATELGDEFATEAALGSVQNQEARKLIEPIVARNSKVKLPQLLSNERVKAWQVATGVTDTQLKQALTKARAALKNVQQPSPVIVPVRKRSRVAAGPVVSKPAPESNTHNTAVQRGLVPNQDLALL